MTVPFKVHYAKKGRLPPCGMGSWGPSWIELLRGRGRVTADSGLITCINCLWFLDPSNSWNDRGFATLKVAEVSA